MGLRYAAIAALIATHCSAALADADPLASQLDDLAIVKSSYVMKNAVMSPADRLAALDRIDAAAKRTSSYAKAEFLIEMMRITAFARNGHDYFDDGGGWFPANRLPISVAWLSDGMVVTRVPAEHARLLGARVLGIEGKGLDEVLATLRNYNGGPDQYIKWNNNWMLTSPEILKAIGIAQHDHRVRFEFGTADGGVETADIAAVSSSTVPADQGRIGAWSGTRSIKETELGWKSAITAADDPLYLQEPTRMFRMLELPRLDALYVQFRTNVDRKDESIVDFARRVKQTLSTTSMRHIILDQRFNSGGNSDLTMALMRDIGKHTKGRVYVLIGPQTFSAGIVSTAIVKQASNNRAVLVGEDVGDQLRWWSEGSDVCLPNSKYCLHSSTGLWDLVRGCEGEQGCYGDRFNIRVNGLAPDISAPMTSTALIAGRDPLLEAVAANLSK